MGATSDADTEQKVYYAMCQDCPGDGVSGGWLGPNRSSSADAQADADKHNDTHPGHSAVVMYPT